MLQPLFVRPTDGGFEVVAGQRRLNACRILAEDGEIAPIPCLIMNAGDDATAIEASLAETLVFSAAKVPGEPKLPNAVARTNDCITYHSTHYQRLDQVGR